MVGFEYTDIKKKNYKIIKTDFPLSISCIIETIYITKTILWCSVDIYFIINIRLR